MNDLRGNYAGDDLRLSGIGGWLAFFGFGLILTLLASAINIIRLYLPIFQNGTLSQLYNINRVIFYVLLFETIATILMFIALVMLCFLFFKKLRLFPKLMFYYMIINFVIVVIDFLLVAQFVSPIIQTDMPNVIQPLVYLIVWGTYLKTSVRVKNTFVN